MGKDGIKEENRDDNSEPNPGKSSRLGKEAKIGVTVIALLLAVLGGVVAMKLSGSSADDKQLAVATDRDGNKEKLGGQSKTDPMFKSTRKPFGGNGSNAPIVVSPGAALGKVPKMAAGDMNKWKQASDRNESKRSDSSSLSLSAPPSFMPDPPKPSHENRRKSDAGDPPAGKDSVDSSGFALSTDPPSALPPYRENSRYGNSTPQQQPTPLRTGGSYSANLEPSTPTMPVVQYNARDYRDDFGEPKHSGVGMRRSSAASLYSNPPPRRDDGKYEVQPNDSYWTISERLYSSGAYFKALAQHNRGKGESEDRLQPGTLIMAPTVAELEKSYPDLCPKPSRREALQSQTQSRTSTVSTRNSYGGGRTYTVSEGDTLFNVARYELGKASRWAEIYDLNRDVLGKDFNYLTPGTQLKLPESEKSDVIARPPGNTYRR